MLRPLALAATLLLAAVPAAFAEIRYQGGDGSTAETAIVILGAEGSSDGIQAEYDWLSRMRPEAEVISQALIQDEGRYYDVLTVRSGGKEEQIHFDITEFFGTF
ncbi:MAG: hypothetical protein HC844_09540 [Tabrizicola sp.]|nr:hypothetical protein [Tabrizicola sp.]